MKKIKEVIVVEGKSDVATLENIIDADYIITNGSSLNQETIDLIKKINRERGIILFLDPDAPGEKIRKAIMEQIPNIKHAFVLAKHAKRGKKLGVAETDRKFILAAIENCVTLIDHPNELINQSQFYFLGLQGEENSKQKRLYLEEYFHLGHGTSKTILKRLNMLGITYLHLKEVMEKKYGKTDSNH